MKKIFLTTLLGVITAFTGQGQQEVNLMPSSYVADSSQLFTCGTELKTDADLQEYASNWSSRVYGVDITKDIEVKFGELDGLCVNGLFTPNKQLLSINSSIVEDVELLERTLIHELTHSCLWELDKPYKDTDTFFQQECLNNGGILNDTEENVEMYSHLDGNEFYGVYEPNTVNTISTFEVKSEILK